MNCWEGFWRRKPQLSDAAASIGGRWHCGRMSAALHLRLGNVLAAQGNAGDAAQHLREAAKGSDAAIAATGDAGA